MSLLFRYPRLPSDAFNLWQKLHHKPRHGFYLGPVKPNQNSSVAYFSVCEPIRIWKNKIPPSQKSPEKRKIGYPRTIGYFGFEAGRLFDPGIKRLKRKLNPLGTPSVYLADYSAVVKIDFLKKETVLCFHQKDKNTEAIRLRFEALFSERYSQQSNEGNKKKIHFSHPTKTVFSKMVAKAKGAITRGDIYQANLSLRFTAPFAKSPLDLYKTLCEHNPSPYACLFKIGNDWIVSSSPELLMRVKGALVSTRPIAGTRPRGVTKKTDHQLQGRLLLSPKERAEHIMLVDLERNDLGRVCKPGSVRVRERFQVERYSHVMHIVSDVVGTLAKNKSSLDALASLFPGGTITGCPKIRAIEIIEDIEGVSRGPFYGSAGFFSDNGDAVFNILIRTALIQRRRVTIQAGAGIVADSNASREYKEVLAKAQALLEACQKCN